MNLISFEKIAKAYGPRVLLDGVSLGVAEGMRVGIVGRLAPFGDWLRGGDLPRQVKQVCSAEPADTG